MLVTMTAITRAIVTITIVDAKNIPENIDNYTQWARVTAMD